MAIERKKKTILEDIYQFETKFSCRPPMNHTIVYLRWCPMTKQLCDALALTILHQYHIVNTHPAKVHQFFQIFLSISCNEGQITIHLQQLRRGSQTLDSKNVFSHFILFLPRGINCHSQNCVAKAVKFWTNGLPIQSKD